MEETKQEKLTNANFQYFKSRVLFYLKKFKLDGYWTIKVVQVEEKAGALGGYCRPEFWNGVAEIGLITKDYPRDKETLNEDLDETARHEVVHLITAKIDSLSRNRFVITREIDDAIEEMTRKITDITEEDEMISGTGGASGNFNCIQPREEYAKPSNGGEGNDGNIKPKI